MEGFTISACLPQIAIDSYMVCLSSGIFCDFEADCVLTHNISDHPAPPKIVPQTEIPWQFKIKFMYQVVCIFVCKREKDRINVIKSPLLLFWEMFFSS